MMELNSFRNCDAQGIVSVWNRQPPLRRRLREITASLLEQHVFAKPYFDPGGLIVAREGDEIVGFLHAGFSPGAHTGELDRQWGLICQLVLDPTALPGVAAGLLAAGEEYLRQRGATEILGGSWGEHAPFYLGLYGGSRLPGVLNGDGAWVEALRAAGFREYRETTIWERELGEFRPPVDRQFLALRRKYQIQSLPSGEETTATHDWCDTCTFAWVERLRHRLVHSESGESCGFFDFWDVEPLASSWKVRALGLLNATFANESLRGELLTCFLGESLRQFQTEGIALVEVQTDQGDLQLAQACAKLGFQQVDRGIQWRKESVP